MGALSTTRVTYAAPGRVMVVTGFAPDPRDLGGRASAGETIDGVSETPQQPEQPENDQVADAPASSEQPKQPELPKSLTFRITPVSLLAVLAILVCATPLAWAAYPWGLLVYLIPLGLAWWILRTRTTVGQDQVKVRTALGGDRFGWDEVTSLRLDEKRWLKAVLTSGKEITLPAVRVRDLPRLSVMSGGRLPNPESQE
ncbi:PH domain-containing protein [Saccharopolyspora kobensis]|uniref:PH domain-containing protein n=1 Tax=Saccharopolyspora kobensis TaxID=146035 RepID=A0A1H6BMP0_9PSEU|nr:PH domain-containing protein [Saccharopolyspora kobensis]SFE86545.1 PH domain-containing protein [Saccharopolyspora kobensis]